MERTGNFPTLDQAPRKPLNTPIKEILQRPENQELRAYQSVVEQVSVLQEDLKPLNDEQLRDRMVGLKSYILEQKTQGQDVQVALKEVLPFAFALVRETSARTIGKEHFDVQLLGGMALFDGHIAQMRTGEGKTLVATLPASLQALSGDGVHVVTVNDYLAKRDTHENGEIYAALGLKVACIQAKQVATEDGTWQESYIYDPKYQSGDPYYPHLRAVTRKEAYKADITYGSNTEFGFDYLRDNIEGSVETQRQRGQSVAIIDEVDSVLIDEAKTPLIIRGFNIPTEQEKKAYQIADSLAKNLSVGTHFILDPGKRLAYLTEEGVDYVTQSLGLDKDLYDPEHVIMVRFIQNALEANNLYRENHEYLIKPSGDENKSSVVLIDPATGRELEGRQYESGLHQALEAKHGQKLTAEAAATAKVSYQHFFKKYGHISGMTGTAESAEEEFRVIYGLDVRVIPTNLPMIRADLESVVYQNNRQRRVAVCEEVIEKNEEGRAVLVITHSVEESRHLSQMLQQVELPHQVLNAADNLNEAGKIAQAGKLGMVTVATDIAGRGTDIILDEEVKARGGLHVVVVGRANNERVDNQARGRAGRQGDPGSSIIFESLEDEALFYSDRAEEVGDDEDQNLEPLTHPIYRKKLEWAQQRTQARDYDQRRTSFAFDEVLHLQREAVYETRQKMLSGDFDVDGLILDLGIDEESLVTEEGEPLTEEEIKAKVKGGVETLDRLWVGHLQVMDDLMEGRGMAALSGNGNDPNRPLTVFRKDSFEHFSKLKRLFTTDLGKRVVYSVTRYPLIEL